MDELSVNAEIKVDKSMFKILLQQKNTLPFIFLLLLFSVQQAAADPGKTPVKVSAKGFVVMDYHSGKIITKSRAYKRLEPASLTKVMTAYLVFDRIKQNNLELDDLSTVSHNARLMTGSRSFLEEGSQVTINQLLKGLIVQSGNDSAIALAEHIAGTEARFVAMMNHKARILGMSNTRFKNVSGFSQKGHYSTAYDLALLAKAMIKNHPEFYSYYSILSFSHNQIKQKNRNLLLRRDPTVDGIKTGFTSNAGYCLIASAKRNGHRLISVVLNDLSARARARSSQLLLEYGFKYYNSISSTNSNTSDYFETLDDY